MKRGAIGILLLLPALALAAPVSPGFLPVSVWYAGGKARAPMLDPVTADSPALWRKDLKQIKALGFNTVRTWVEWTAGEPREQEYHLEALDLMLNLAGEEGLKVIVQVYVDSAPDWLARKFPDGHLVAQNGQAIPSQAVPGFCFDHPGVRQATLDFLRETARHAAKSPAFFGWDLWSEPHIINWAEINYIPNASFCYCSYSMARFREWLQNKYGGIPQLNNAWYRQFQAWSEVEPPRFDTILSYADYMDWRVFITQKLADDLRTRTRAVKQILPDRVATSHAAGPSALGSFASGDGNPDDYLMYQAVDYYGTSLYPKHSLPPHMSPMRVQMAVDLTRSAGNNRGFYIGELQGGFGVRGDIVSQEITALDVVRYMWTAISRGARGINIYAWYPMNAGYESGGYGLINLDGTLTDRGRLAGETARQIEANSDLLLRAHPKPAEVAIVVNQLTNLIGGAGHLYNRGAVARSLSGYYRMFAERNIPVDFVDAAELTAAQVSHYKLIVLPYPILMLSKEAGALEQYVRQGGHLFTEARPGWVDERGYAQEIVPGFGWEQMLGVREKSTTPKPQTEIRWGDRRFAGAIFEERFTVLRPEARPLAWFEDGSPAAFECKFGSGSAIIVGTFPGQANESPEAVSQQRSNIVVGSLPGTPRQPDGGLHPLGGFLASWAGVAAPDLNASAPVDLQQLVADSGRMVFLMNWGASPAAVKLTIPLDRAPKQVREITTGQALPHPAAAVHLDTDVPAQGVRVYRIDY
ncbi:MAG TPA: beta-galactosidase [Bryobacteraceae bacterium]|jgi:beta-galactosidase|nr:beta-galactosidase [Bryobacteraceae bacterium]